MKPYFSFNEAMRQRFGCKVYKLSLDAGLGCPNRDGTCGDRGCSFCSAAGSGEFAARLAGDVRAQLAQARARVAHKNPGGKYVAYFQSFSNTYAPVSVLAPLYRAAMEPEEIVALDVATRPDCLPPEVVALLAERNREKPVWVELGLQTIHPETARAIRRGYALPMFDDAVRRLRAAGLEVIVHQILGLPGETPEMMWDTTRYIARSGAAGIKLHLLHILDDADLYQDYLAGRVSVLDEAEYFAILARCLRLLPPQMVVHRLTGDGDKRHLAAPLWSADKKRVLADLNRYLAAHGVQQGSEYTAVR